MNGALLALQVLFLACAYMPGVAQPARGALLLMSLFAFGMNAGIALCKARIEKEGL